MPDLLRAFLLPGELAPGDAVVFYPDQEVHEVAPVAGTRLLLSVGALL